MSSIVFLLSGSLESDEVPLTTPGAEGHELPSVAQQTLHLARRNKDLTATPPAGDERGVM